jgi:hypothetical protein
MPRKPVEREGGAKDAPRTDLLPKKEPYYDGYFGTEEEAGVEREREAPDAGPAGETSDRS